MEKNIKVVFFDLFFTLVTPKYKVSGNENEREERFKGALTEVDSLILDVILDLKNKGKKICLLSNANTVNNPVEALQSTQIFNRKQNVKQEIKRFYDKWRKPIFFGELGFPKTDKASIEPYNPYLSTLLIIRNRQIVLKLID